jgi:hypothetical protein
VVESVPFLKLHGFAAEVIGGFVVLGNHWVAASGSIQQFFHKLPRNPRREESLR